MTKLTDNQANLMAAVLGVSNAGKDDLFLRSRDPTLTVDLAKRLYGNPRRPLDAEDIAWTFCGWFAESEEMAEIFIDEVRDWLPRVRKMTREKVAKTWPEYAPYLECTT